jgi:ankyrin repeat protein
MKPIPHLHYAILNAKPGYDCTILTYLLSQNGINVNIKDTLGNTLLHLACKGINSLPLDLFKSLVEIAGSDINIQDVMHYTPVYYAICSLEPKNKH